MNYWDIRKRKALNHLPAPDPELVRAGVSDSDQNYQRSRRWLEMYHELKKEPPDVQITQDTLMADADASSKGYENAESGTDAAAGASLEFAPR